MLQRLNTSLHRLYYRHCSRTRHKIVRLMDAEFVVRPDNYIDRRMWAEGGYETEQLSYMRDRARIEGGYDAFVDIGANFGLYSCILGQEVAIQRVHSFECDPRNLLQLYGHIRMNSLMDKLYVHPYALGADQRTITLNMAANDSTGRSSVTIAAKNGKSIEVEQNALDHVLPLKDQRLMIKIDVEGYEAEVLKGMRSLLNNNRCFIQMEILDDAPEKLGDLLPDTYKNVHRIGHDWYFSNEADI